MGRTQLTTWPSAPEAFRRSNELVGRVVAAVHAVHEGVWLGFLDRHLLNDVTRRHYEKNVLYARRDHNLSGLRPWEHAAVERFFAGRSSVLVGAAGGGREMLALLAMGFRVDGFECNVDLLQIGTALVEERRYDARVFESIADRVPNGCGTYEAAVVGSGAYSHIAGSATRTAFLRELRAHVVPGGPVLLSFFMRRGIGRAKTAARVANLIRRVRRSGETIELGDMLHGGAFEHWFSEAEVREEIESAGYSVESFSDDPLGHLIARRVE